MPQNAETNSMFGPPTTFTMTKAVVTKRNGAIALRNETTAGSFQRTSSSGVGASGSKSTGGVHVGAACGYALPIRAGNCGTLPVSSACTKARASGKRSSGFFSRQSITARAKSGGTLARCSIGTGFSLRCFTKSAGALVALNGRSPQSI
jgi:hypothetical protein